MSRTIIPVTQLDARIPTAGRLRFGTKKRTAKGTEYPVAIPHWRLSSHDKEAIEQIATLYGGTPEAWTDAPTAGQWQVFTEASELSIMLPPDPLGGSPIYELWSGGGCQRRCDGITVTTLQATGPDTVDAVESPCICSARGRLECKVTTRLSVLLPEIKFAGVWRLDSGSWNVAHEFPGMVAMIQQLQARGIVRARLGLEHRKVVVAGKTKAFIIPTLRVAESPNAILEGAAAVGALASGSQVVDAPALNAGDEATVCLQCGERDCPQGTVGFDQDDATAALGYGFGDDEVVDGEIVDVAPIQPTLPEPAPGTGTPAAESPPPPPATTDGNPFHDDPPPPTEAGDPHKRRLRAFHAALRDAYAIPKWVTDKNDRIEAARHQLLAEYHVESSKDLPLDVLERIIAACKAQPAKVREVSGLPAEWGPGPDDA